MDLLSPFALCWLCVSVCTVFCVPGSKDYQWGQWGSWGTCSVTCGEGERSRTRACVDRASNKEDNTQCTGDRLQTQKCRPAACEDYQWGQWGSWGTCSVTCGEGERSRTRTCVDRVSKKEDNTQCTGDKLQTQKCRPAACEDYQWGQWGSWGTCSVTCGEGERSRTRACVDRVSKKEDNTQCTGDRLQTKKCTAAACNDYQWGQWGSWGTCSVTCGEGERSRTRACVDRVSKKEDNTQCTGDKLQTQKCRPAACEDYQWGQWESWGTCSVTCGEGERSRTRACVDRVSKKEDNTQCTGDRLQTKKCTAAACNDYQWGQWGSWGTCSVTCGEGERSRTRACVDRVSNKKDNTQCTGDKLQTQKCTRAACEDYQWGQWGSWGTCSVTCGEGERSRTRACVDRVSNKKDNTQCTGDKLQSEKCTPATCKVYQWSSWDAWGSCTLTCGGGQRSRGRRCVDKDGGQEVTSSQCSGPKSEDERCHTQKCPVYQWSSWDAWGSCTLTCGGGQRSRGRRCMDKGSGQEVTSSQCSGPKSENERCHTQTCSKPVWQTWEQWTACSKSCGVGVRSRARTCTLEGVASTLCMGKKSASRKCVIRCKNLSKEEIVKEIKSETNNSQAVERLEKWAQSTSHMTENLFNSELLTNYALVGHVLHSLSVSSAMDCAVNCMKAGQCKSFNLRLDPDRNGKRVCELNSANREEALSDVREKVGYVLYDYNVYVPFMEDLN